MLIETTTQEYSNHQVGTIVVDDTLDIIVVKQNGVYTVKVLENNCVDVNLEMVNMEE